MPTGPFRRQPMNATPSVPVTITPEAAARVAELGMEKELEQMLEHARQVVPDLKRLDVVLAHREPLGAEPGVTVRVTTARPFVPGDRTDWDLGVWTVNTFPARVCEYLLLDLYYETLHAG